MVYASRSNRRDEACSLLTKVADKLREISVSLEDIEETEEIKDRNQKTKEIESAKALIAEIDSGEFESLKDEMESWASGMEGTNLEHTSKYETVSEAANALGDVVSNLEGISVPDIDLKNLSAEDIKNFVQDIVEIADNIENIIGDAESIEFPGMYG